MRINTLCCFALIMLLALAGVSECLGKTNQRKGSKRSTTITHLPEQSALRIVATKQMEGMTKREISMKQRTMRQRVPDFKHLDMAKRHNPALPRPPKEPVVVNK